MLFDVTKEIYPALENGNYILKECLPNYKEPTISNIEYKLKSKSYWAKIGLNSKKYSNYFIRVGGLFSLIPDYQLAKIRFQSTIIHELIHTIPGCMNHGPRFQLICNVINRKYPQYQLQTCTDVTEFGIQKDILENAPKWKVICPKCGKEYFYCRKPKYDIDHYFCSKCNCDKLILQRGVM